MVTAIFQLISAAAYSQADPIQPNVTQAQDSVQIPSSTTDNRKWITAVGHSPIKIAVSPGKSCALKVDIGMQRLMASSSAGDSLFSLSLDTQDGREIHFASFNAITVDTDDDKIFATTNDQAVMVLDRKSLVRIDKIVLPGHCGAAVYVPSCKRVLVAHQTTNNVWSIDAKLHTLGISTSLNAPVSELIYDSGTDKVLALCQSTNQIAVIDPWTMVVSAYWGLGSASSISSLGVDDGLGVIFCGDTNGTLTAMDVHTGVVEGSVAVGGPINEMAYDPTAQQIYCLSSDLGQVSVVQLARGGGVINLGEITAIPGIESAAVIRGSNTSTLWLSFVDQRGTYIQRYTVML